MRDVLKLTSETLPKPKKWFWKKVSLLEVAGSETVQESESRFDAAVTVQCTNDRLSFEATTARMMRDAAQPALGKSTRR
jgi:hypothetical protein